MDEAEAANMPVVVQRLTVIVHESGKTVECLVPTDPLPLVTAGFTHFGITQPRLALDIVEQPGPFGAQRTATHRVIRVAFNVKDTGFRILGAIAHGVHEDAATD